ncbi:MAG: MFS transporter [Gemmatimonadaceae bacterium]|nr:MFS transporter [Acetobacteraceae bacterium]
MARRGGGDGGRNPHVGPASEAPGRPRPGAGRKDATPVISRGARVNLLIGTGHFLSHFYILVLPPMFLAWQQEFAVSYAELGLSVALMSGVTGVLQTPVGFLVDRYGARRFLVGGTLVMSLSIGAMGFATEFWQVLVLAALSGVGNSVIHPADYSILSGSVDKDRMGRAFALHTFAGNLGFALAPPVIVALTAAFGWRTAMMLVGGVGVPVVAAILVQSRILHDQARTPAGPVGSGRALLLSRPMLLFFGFFLLGSMAGAGVTSWVVTVLHAVHGLDVAAASSALTGYMVGNTGGVLLGGWMSDRSRRLAAITVGLTVGSAALVLLVAVLPLGAVGSIVVLFASGVTLGASRTPRDMMVRDAAPPGQVGKVFGFVSAGLPLGSALTPVPFGFLIDRGHPELVLVLVAAVLLLSLLCMGSARNAVRAEPVAAE